jgi:hypothetical protein
MSISEAPESLPSPDELVLATGPMMLGFLFSYGLYGVLCSQLFTYCMAFPNDSKNLKILVWTVFALETVLTVLITRGAWWNFVSGFGQLDHMKRFDESTPFQVPVVGLITLSFHTFYAWRIYQMSHRKRLLPLVIVSLSSTHLAITLYVAVHGLQTDGRIDALMGTRFAAVYGSWMGIGMLADILVTCSMTVILIRAKRQAHRTHVSARISRILKFTMETGLAITVLAIVMVLCYIIRRDTLLFFLFYYIQTRLYSNLILSSLNSRFMYAQQPGHPHTEVLSTLQPADSDETDYSGLSFAKPSSSYPSQFSTASTHDQAEADVASLELPIIKQQSRPRSAEFLEILDPEESVV